jgi:hypothetical protein
MFAVAHVHALHRLQTGQQPLEQKLLADSKERLLYTHMNQEVRTLFQQHLCDRQPHTCGMSIRLARRV